MLARLVTLSLVGAAAAVPAARPGLKIVTRDDWPPTSVATTRYVLTDRSRVETRRGDQETIALTRCDLQRTVVLDTARRTYSELPLHVQPNRLVRLLVSLASRRHAPAPAPTLLIETTTVDTGERKTMLGYAARRVITTRRDIPLQDQTALPREQRTDGWYIDIETRPSCERDSESARAVLVFAQAGPDGRPITPVVTFKDIGAPERGFAVDVTTTSESGRESRRVVTELSRVNLDPALFEIPRGFKPAEGPLSGLTAAWARTWFLLKAAVFP